MFSYLEERKEKIAEIIVKKKKELDDINYTLVEDERFMELLEKEKVVPFVEFTPQVISRGEQKKQRDMTEKMDGLKARKEAIEKELRDLEAERDKIEETISLIIKTLADGSKARNTEQTRVLEKLKEVQGLVITYPQRALAIINEIIESIS